MYLTDKKNGQPRLLNDHEELEVLLESFAKQVEEIVNEAENMQVNSLPSHYGCHGTKCSIDERAIHSRNCGAYSGF